MASYLHSNQLMNKTIKLVLQLILGTAVIFPAIAPAQSRVNEAKIDSLHTVINQLPENDTGRIDILKSLSKLYLYKDARQAVLFGQQGTQSGDGLDPAAGQVQARLQPPPEGPIPEGLSATELMEQKLLTERCRRLYKLRGQTVEPVFGQIKDVRGFDRFMRRGIEACRSEWSLICATHNLLKLWRSGKACWN